MAKKIRLGLDLDGVLFDFNTAFCKLLSAKFDAKMPMPSADWPEQWDYPTLGGYITKDQDREVWRSICRGEEKNFWLNLPYYDHSAALIAAGNDRAQEVYYITSRCGSQRLWESTQAVEELLEEARLNSFVFTDDTPTVIPVDNHLNKLPIINALNLTHYIDDRPDTMLEADYKCPRTKLALWDQPWNRHINLSGVARLRSVEEFKQWLR